MKTQIQIRTQRKKSGFTLIEVIAVLVLLGILAAIAVPKYIDMAENARSRALDAAVAELNGREALTWGNVMISDTGYTDDATVFAAVDTVLSSDYSWSAAPTVSGGTLSFQGATGVALSRTASLGTQPGTWSR